MPDEFNSSVIRLPVLKNSPCLVIVGSDDRAIAVARAAFELAAPAGRVQFARSLDELLASDGAPMPAILAVLSCDHGDVSRAAGMKDALHLPAWAVVCRGAAPASRNVESVGAEDWLPNVLAVAFRLSWSRLLLQRENAGFRGDLQSIGTRIVHDLRSPLGGILASTEALGEFLAARAPGEVDRTRQILASEEDLMEMVRKLSHLSHDFSSPVELDRFNMGNAVGSVLERLEREILGKGDSVIQPASWPEVSGDQRKLERVWYHLIHNAVVHAGPNRSLEFSWEHAGGEFKFFLQDDGVGVPPEIKPLLFWPFHRLCDPSAARGLGLPIVERLVRLHGGQTAFEPRVGGGSSFSFSLPE